MKNALIKFVLFCSVFTLFSITALQAQTGIGIRGLWGFDEDSYGGVELSMQKLNKWEMDLGWNENDIWKFTYLKQFKLIQIGDRFGAIYGGIGASGGYNEPKEEVISTVAGNVGAFVLLGAIELGLDWRPEFGLLNVPNEDFTFTTALSVRFMLGKPKSIN
ncbi:MAG: hypothetical protein IPP71_17415 [Bacteroidetes bacterium]|nr:hypothetical protein [Bacteroidota bacterium]